MEFPRLRAWPRPRASWVEAGCWIQAVWSQRPTPNPKGCPQKSPKEQSLLPEWPLQFLQGCSESPLSWRSLGKKDHRDSLWVNPFHVENKTWYSIEKLEVWLPTCLTSGSTTKPQSASRCYKSQQVRVFPLYNSKDVWNRGYLQEPPSTSLQGEEP